MRGTPSESGQPFVRLRADYASLQRTEGHVSYRRKWTRLSDGSPPDNPPIAQAPILRCLANHPLQLNEISVSDRAALAGLTQLAATRALVPQTVERKDDRRKAETRRRVRSSILTARKLLILKTERCQSGRLSTLGNCSGDLRRRAADFDYRCRSRDLAAHASRPSITVNHGRSRPIDRVTSQLRHSGRAVEGAGVFDVFLRAARAPACEEEHHSRARGTRARRRATNPPAAPSRPGSTQFTPDVMWDGPSAVEAPLKWPPAAPRSNHPLKKSSPNEARFPAWPIHDRAVGEVAPLFSTTKDPMTTATTLNFFGVRSLPSR